MPNASRCFVLLLLVALCRPAATWAQSTGTNPPQGHACRTSGPSSAPTPVKCSVEALATCKAKRHEINVDDFLNTGKDDESTAVCVIQGSADVITWTADETGKHKNFKVNSMADETSGKPSSPFSSGPPYGSVHGKAKSPRLNQSLPPLAAGYCYEFKSEIQDSGQCYDPHIYVGCDGCGATGFKREKKKKK